MTKERTLEYRLGILSTRLPQTIQDAIRVTQSLKLQYLWVDSLCILQDDPQEKAAEIDKMARYFKEAEVTIYTASAKAVLEGFLGIKGEIKYTIGLFELQYRCLSGELGSI